MTIGSSPHRSLGPTLVWLEARLAELEAKGDYEASFALTSEMADWLMRSPEAMHDGVMDNFRAGDDLRTVVDLLTRDVNRGFQVVGLDQF